MCLVCSFISFCYKLLQSLPSLNTLLQLSHDASLSTNNYLAWPPSCHSASALEKSVFCIMFTSFTAQTVRWLSKHNSVETAIKITAAAEELVHLIIDLSVFSSVPRLQRAYLPDRLSRPNPIGLGARLLNMRLENLHLYSQTPRYFTAHFS